MHIPSREQLEAIGNRLRLLDREERRLLLSKDDMRRREEELRSGEESLRHRLDTLGKRSAEVEATARAAEAISRAARTAVGLPPDASEDAMRERLSDLERRAKEVEGAERRVAAARELVAQTEQEQEARGREFEERERAVLEAAAIIRVRERDVAAREDRLKTLMPLLARWSLSAQDEEAKFTHPEALAGLPIAEGKPATLKVAKAAVLEEVRDILRKKELLEAKERELEEKMGIVERIEKEAHREPRRALGWRAQVYGLDRG
jgi:hypothetical protein